MTERRPDEPVIDLGYMSLPAEVQQAIEAAHKTSGPTLGPPVSDDTARESASAPGHAQARTSPVTGETVSAALAADVQWAREGREVVWQTLSTERARNLLEAAAPLIRTDADPVVLCPNCLHDGALERALERARAAEAKMAAIAEICRDECSVVSEGARLVAIVRASDILAIIISEEAGCG